MDENWDNYQKATDQGPRCPNHRVPLILTNDPGVGICPISHCRFAYTADVTGKKEEDYIKPDGTIGKRKKFEVKSLEGEEPY